MNKLTIPFTPCRAFFVQEKHSRSAALHYFDPKMREIHVSQNSAIWFFNRLVRFLGLFSQERSISLRRLGVERRRTFCSHEQNVLLLKLVQLNGIIERYLPPGDCCGGSSARSSVIWPALDSVRTR